MHSSNTCSTSKGASSAKPTHVSSLRSLSSYVPPLLWKTDSLYSTAMFPWHSSMSSLPSATSLLAASMSSLYLSSAAVSIFLLSHPGDSRTRCSIRRTETVFRSASYSTYFKTGLVSCLSFKDISNLIFLEHNRRSAPLCHDRFG